MAEATVDRAVGRILRVKFMLGLFENPYTDPGLAARVLNSAEHKELALQAAREAVCLLKNEGGLLPLRQDLKSIAVIGPNADEARLGDYTTADATGVTVLEGVRQKVSPQTVVRYVRGMGVTLEDGDVLPVPSSCLAPPDGKGHGLRGEYFGNMELKGPPARPIRPCRQTSSPCAGRGRWCPTGASTDGSARQATTACACGWTAGS